MTTLQEKIAVMQAAAEGKAIQQTYRKQDGKWYDTVYYDWDWAMYEYRVRPEKVRVRVAKWKVSQNTTAFILHTEEGFPYVNTDQIEAGVNFRGWATDWIEVEKAT